MRCRGVERRIAASQTPGLPPSASLTSPEEGERVPIWARCSRASSPVPRCSGTACSRTAKVGDDLFDNVHHVQAVVPSRSDVAAWKGQLGECGARCAQACVAMPDQRREATEREELGEEHRPGGEDRGAVLRAVRITQAGE
jgi:hypothetical protein